MDRSVMNIIVRL